MACTALHLLIAEEYCKKNKAANMDIFLIGAFWPDIQEDKVASHFGLKIKPKSIKEALDAKIVISNCVNSLNFEDEMDRSIFLHLLTDFIYYNYIYKAELESIKLEQILKFIQNDAEIITTKILREHHYYLPEEYKHLLKLNESFGDCKLFDGLALDSFVEMIASFDLKEVKKEIMKNDKIFLQRCFEMLNNDKIKIQ